MADLKKLVEDQLGVNGIMVEGTRDHYAEIMDTKTGHIWMALTPANQADLKALDLPEGFVPTGAAQVAMDYAGFCHAPDDKDIPIRVQEIAGRTFINNTLPGPAEMPAQLPRTMQITNLTGD